jgi:hypothetical protein
MLLTSEKKYRYFLWGNIDGFLEFGILMEFFEGFLGI